MGEAAFTLAFGGEPAPAELLEAVHSIEVENHAEQADMLRMRLATSVAREGGRWDLLDAGLLNRLTNVRVGVRVGDGPNQPLIDAYLIDLRAEFSSEPGHSSVEIVAMDGSALLQLEQRVRSWAEQSDAQIAEAIFAAAGLDTEVEPTQPARASRHEVTVQRGDDLSFLRRLAERNGFEVYLEVGPDGRGVGHFHAPRLERKPQAVLNVNMGPATNVDGFKARHEMLRPTAARAAGLDVETRREQPVAADAAQQAPLGAAPATASERPRLALLSGTGLSQASELRTAAQAVVDRAAMALSAEGTVYPVDLDTVLRAKHPLLVRGAGGELSGTWYVTRVRHELGGEGYAQQLELRRNATGLTRTEDFSDDKALAPQPAVSV
jgi:phage protein D